MSTYHEIISATPENPYTVAVTDRPDDLADGQRLRYEVFHDELGAALPNSTVGADGIARDTDVLDAASLQLQARDATTGELAGTYRLLPPDKRDTSLPLFSEHMFELAPELTAAKTEIIEIGRAVVGARFRGNEGVQLLLLAGLLGYQQSSDYTAIMGCMSARMDGIHDPQGNPAPRGTLVKAAYDYAVSHGAMGESLATPRRPVEVDGTALMDLSTPQLPVELLPPMIRHTVRIGGRILGPPSYDPDFDMSDFLVYVRLEFLDPSTIEQLAAILGKEISHG